MVKPSKLSNPSPPPPPAAPNTPPKSYPSPPEKKSKRVPVRLRHKIEKRGAEKQRKERKDVKKHPELHRKKKNEKLNIPNSFPYKDRLLAEIEDQRRTKVEEQVRKREEAKARKKAGDVGEEAMVDAGHIEDEADSDDMDEDMSDSGVSFFPPLSAKFAIVSGR